MGQQSGFTILTLMVGLLTTIPVAGAQQREGAGAPNASVVRHAATAGIRTDRLSCRQLRTWRNIERLVFARDAAGGPLHPTLHDRQ